MLLKSFNIDSTLIQHVSTPLKGESTVHKRKLKKQKGSHPVKLSLGFVNFSHENGSLFLRRPQSQKNSKWRSRWNYGLFTKTTFRDKEIGVSCPKTRSGIRIPRFLVNLMACWMKNMTPKAITQCQNNSYDVMLNSRRRLGETDFRSKIKFL